MLILEENEEDDRAFSSRPSSDNFRLPLTNNELQSKVTELETNYRSTLTELTENKGMIQNLNQQVGSLEEIIEQNRKYIRKLES